MNIIYCFTLSIAIHRKCNCFDLRVNVIFVQTDEHMNKQNQFTRFSHIGPPYTKRNVDHTNYNQRKKYHFSYFAQKLHVLPA